LAKQLCKAPVCLVMPIHLPFHLSVLMKQYDSHPIDLSDISYLCFSLKYIGTLRYWLKSDQNHRHFMWRCTYVFAVGLHDGDSVTFEVQTPKNQLII